MAASIDIDIERGHWNDYNSTFRRIGDPPDDIAADEVATLRRWLSGRSGLEILDVGCGSGWTCGMLSEYGSVVGTDLADGPLNVARKTYPQCEFIAGDFAAIDFGTRKFDVIVCIEVLSHVEKQPAFMTKIAKLLKPGGELLMATQNRPVLERNSSIKPAEPGHRRKWVSKSELKVLLHTRFAVVELTTLTPKGHGGILKLVNSTKLTQIAGSVIGARNVKRLKERFGLGWTIMVRARAKQFTATVHGTG